MKKIVEISRLFEPGSAVACFLILFLIWPFPMMAQTAPGRGLPKGLPGGLESVLKGGQGSGTAQAESEKIQPGGSGGMSLGMENQVHVLGEVKSPGTYRVGASVRAAEVVASAGGIGERGSFRNIELRRLDLAVTRLDLFRFYSRGDLGANPFLQDNDVIFVPFKSKSVRIEGPVKKSGVFELAGETNVWDIIQLAGGFTVGAAQKDEIVVVRYENEKKQMIRVPNVTEELRRTPIQNGDIIVVPHIFTKNREFDYSFPNLPTDDVFYPSYNDQIFVAGAVLKPGSYDYEGHLAMLDYINMAGPDPKKASLKKIQVMRPDGTRVGKVNKHILSPGDTILVPERKLTGGNALSWYNTFASSLFTYVSLRSLIRDLN